MTCSEGFISEEGDRLKLATVRSWDVRSMAFFEQEYIFCVFCEEKPGDTVGWYGAARSCSTNVLLACFFGDAVVSRVSG